MKPTEVWAHIMSSFESQLSTRVFNVCMALSTTKKNADMPVSKYMSKMKTHADKMTCIGKRLGDEDLISYILVSLDSDTT
jgi:hypothetical protein